MRYIRSLCVILLCCVLFAGCDLSDKTFNTEHTAHYKAIEKKTLEFFAKDKTDDGLRFLDSAFATISNPTPSDYVQRYGWHYAVYKRGRGDLKMSRLYADSMLLYARKTKIEKYRQANLANANFALGDVFFDLKRYNEAYQCYYQGYLMGKNYLNNDALSDFTYRMGMIQYQQARYKVAAKYFKESFEHNLKLADNFVSFYRKQELLDNIGLCYANLGINDSAIVYYNKALNYIADHRTKYADRADALESAKGVVYGNKAEVFITQGKLDAAADMLKKSIVINLRKGNDYSDAELTEIKLGMLYLQRNQLDKLADLMGTLRQHLDSVANQDAEADWNRLMADYYLKKKDYENAAAHLKTYQVQKDTLNKRLQALIESNVMQQVANYEKQREIDNLSNNNKLQRIYLYVAIVCAVMLVIIIFLVYRNWERSKQRIKLVNIHNEEVNSQKNILEHTLAELNISSREKDRILRTVAHDLRNPLGGIASLCTLLLLEDDLNAEQKEMVELVKESARNSLELINEILEATNSTDRPLQKESVDVNALVHNSVELLRFKAAEKNQRIKLELLTNTRSICANREKIWRVLGNLISNAIKFSKEGGEITVSLVDEANEVKIAVTDQGIGIPDHLKNQIFNMFTDAKRPGTNGEKSFGLGLSICKQIIEKHQGKIWFESNLDKGTTFYIRLQKTT